MTSKLIEEYWVSFYRTDRAIIGSFQYEVYKEVTILF